MPVVNHLLGGEHFANIKGIIFDCDGVMFDSMGSNRGYYNAILDKMGLPPMTEAQEQYVHAHTAGESLAFIVPDNRKDDLPAALKQVNYFTDVLPHLIPEPGLHDTLGYLRDRGIKLGVCTNRTNTMDMVAEVYGLRPYFSVILSAMNMTPKPSPHGLNKIMDMWQMTRDEVVYVGDTSVDEQAAQACGVRFWAFRSPGLMADLHIQDFWSLRAAMKLTEHQQ